MRIVMMTNTYLPMVGGVSRSVASFTAAFRGMGHHVLVVAPTFAHAPADEVGVVRVPAIQQFNGSDFSVQVPIPGVLLPTLERFRPQIIHSHHPFLIGDTALRTAAHFNIPAVFTHHTMYEQYTHYVPGDSLAMKHFAVALATAYANLCDHVVAPSASVADILRGRGVAVPITAAPSGIDIELFAAGRRGRGRAMLGIPMEDEVVGHVGRLAPEKNLAFLSRAVAAVMQRRPAAWFVAVGDGPSADDIRAACAGAGVEARLRLTGPLDGRSLADAYAAMDVFAFASRSETQGLVLAEAMAAGVPVVAVDAPGTRDVVVDGCNGRLLLEPDEAAFATTVGEMLDLPEATRSASRHAARSTASGLAIPVCARRLLGVYEGLLGKGHRGQADDRSPWAAAVRRLQEEWNLWAGKGAAASDALFGRESRRPSGPGSR